MEKNHSDPDRTKILFFFSSFLRPVSPVSRLEHLEQIFINTNINKLKELQSTCSETSSKILSVESLLDCLIVLFDECQNSSLRREKTVSEFLELCKSFASLSITIQCLKFLDFSETCREQYQATAFMSRGL
jgi:hypothetical protein